MIFENILKNFFGWGEAEDEIQQVVQSTSSLDIGMAIAAHENWKLRLQAFLSGNSSETFIPEEICFDNQCDLGQWIYGPGRAKLGNYPGFTALQGHHKMFHYAASNVVALAQSGKSDDAKKMLDMQFAQHSKDVINDLEKLQSIVRKASLRK